MITANATATGELSARCCLRETTFAFRQIEDGLAWHFKKYEDEQPAMDRVKHSRAESDARAARVGLWRDPQPVPPWEFRGRARAQGVLLTMSADDGQRMARI
ncbi:MAG: thermonuclease family protein [Burkholderiales bacterium]